MRVHSSVVIALVLAEPLLISHLTTPSHLGVLDELRRPIDKNYSRGCSGYYEIRSQTVCPSGVPTKMNAAQPVAAEHRRMP